MPSVADMSLIWNDIGSYIKSSFSGERGSENSDKIPPKEKLETKSNETDDHSSPGKIDISPKKETNENPESESKVENRINPSKLNVIEKDIDSSTEPLKQELHNVESKPNQCSSELPDKDKIVSIESTEMSKNSKDNKTFPHNDDETVEQQVSVSKDVEGGNPKATEESSKITTVDDKDGKGSHKHETDNKSQDYNKHPNDEKESLSDSRENVLDKQKLSVIQDDQNKTSDESSNQPKDKERKSGGDKHAGHENAPTHGRIVRDAGSASRSSSLLGQKRASSKSVSRKADYGKRALSSSDADKESSEEESDSECESNVKSDKNKCKKEEKSTLKKRRKEVKSSYARSEDSSISSTSKVELPGKDVPQTSTRKKSKAGAKRKPTDLSSESLNQELEEIKRLKHGGQELDEESSDTHESPSDVSDTEEDVDEKSQHLLQKLRPIESSDLSKTVDEPDGWRNEQHIKHKLVDTPKQLVTFNLSSVASDEPYKSILSSLPSSKANNTWLNESEQEKKVESEMKKEFNDVSKLQEDQKKCMKRAKDLLKAAFSESESDSEDSDTEGTIPNTEDPSRGISDDDVTLS